MPGSPSEWRACEQIVHKVISSIHRHPVAPQWIRTVSWAERTLSVALTRRQIEQSSEYDPKYLLSRDYEHALHQPHSRPHHWE